MLKRLFLGLIKGILIGGALGVALHFAIGSHLFGPAGVLPFLFYGGVVGVAGVFAGQEPWKQGAWISSILKGVFGFAIGLLMFWLTQKFLGSVPAPAVLQIPAGTKLVQSPLFLAPALATIYTTLVELDDGGEQTQEDNKSAGTKVRASGKKSPMEILDEIDVGEDENVKTKKRSK